MRRLVASWLVQSRCPGESLECPVSADGRESTATLTKTLLRLLILTSIILFVWIAGASGHDVSQSESKVEVHGPQVRVILRLNLLELGYVDANRDGRVSYDELDTAIDRIYADVKSHYILRTPDLPLQITLTHYGIVEDHILDMDLLYRFPHDLMRLEVISTLYQITQPAHEHLISVNIDGTVHEGILDAAAPSAVFATDDGTYLQTVLSFIGLGITHIFTGYDHLAFLVGLLIVTTSLAALVKVVTSFTIAHSITLALATLNLVVLPARLTESLIPLTIGYVAVENLLGMRTVARYRITFIFGLIHGFGFSNVLREMQLSRAHLVLSLFSFNTGVEIGQIAFVLVIFPLVIYMASSPWRQQSRFVVSLVVMCLAVYWFVQRAFLV